MNFSKRVDSLAPNNLEYGKTQINYDFVEEVEANSNDCEDGEDSNDTSLCDSFYSGRKFINFLCFSKNQIILFSQ